MDSMDIRTSLGSSTWQRYQSARGFAPADYREDKCDVHGGLFAFGARLRDVTFIELPDQTGRTRMSAGVSEQEVIASVSKGLDDLLEITGKFPITNCQALIHLHRVMYLNATVGNQDHTMEARIKGLSGSVDILERLPHSIRTTCGDKFR